MSGPFRPIKEIDTSNPVLRAVWWNPVAVSPLPNWKVWVAVGIGVVVFLDVQPLLSLLLIVGSIAFVVVKRRANTAPVEATSLNVIRQEISAAIDRVVKQIGPDLGITAEEFEDASASKLLLVLAQGVGPVEVQSAPGVFRNVETYVAIVTPRGLGYLTSVYDTVNQTFSPGQRELLLWKRVARVRVSGNLLEIEATSGTSTSVPLDTSTRVVQAGFGESITDLVNPFVRKAQDFLEANA